MKRKLVYGVETWTTIKKKDSKIQVMGMQFCSASLNKTNKNRIRNTNIRFKCVGLNKKLYSKEWIKMVWTRDAYGRREAS